MAFATFTLTVDNVGQPEPVRPPVACTKVTLVEDIEVAAAQIYYIRQPLATSTKYPKMAGAEHVFEARQHSKLDFSADETIGFVETKTGSTVFYGICE